MKTSYSVRGFQGVTMTKMTTSKIDKFLKSLLIKLLQLTVLETPLILSNVKLIVAKVTLSCRTVGVSVLH